jgi:hypothetical protein
MSCLIKFVEIKFQITQNNLHLEPMERWDITAPKTTMNEIITDFIKIITDFIRIITDFILITTEDILRSTSLMDKINGKILIS